MDRGQIKISFIELLYAVAIGASFSVIPANPLSNIFGFLVFIFSIGVAGYDWYQYHDSIDEIKDGYSFGNFLLQIIVIMLLSLMLVHAFDTSLFWWLIFWGCIDLIDLFWNVTINFEKKWLYVTTSAIQCIAIFSMVYLLKTNILMNNFIAFGVVFIAFCLLWPIEKYFDKS